MAPPRFTLSASNFGSRQRIPVHTQSLLMDFAPWSEGHESPGLSIRGLLNLGPIVLRSSGAKLHEGPVSPERVFVPHCRVFPVT